MSNLKSLHLSSWKGDTGLEDIRNRDAYQAQAELDCKRAHPSASKVQGIGRKPYTNCVNDKMGQYDAMVADKKAAEKAERDLLEFAKKETVKQASLAAEAQNTSAQATVITAQNEGTGMLISGIFGILIISAALFWLYKTINKPATTPVAANVTK
jgi:hypothetical protein